MGIIFRPVIHRIELEVVHNLTYVTYLAKGYCEPNERRRLVHYPALDFIPQTQVLVAVDDHQIVGTISWTRDGPAGLHADLDFKDEVDNIRRLKRPLASAWRLAVAPHARTSGKVLLGLINQTVQTMTNAGVRTALFTFHPSHVAAYKAILNMSEVARSDQTVGLQNAPAVLMRLDLENVPPKFMRHWVG